MVSFRTFVPDISLSILQKVPLLLECGSNDYSGNHLNAMCGLLSDEPRCVPCILVQNFVEHLWTCASCAICLPHCSCLMEETCLSWKMLFKTLIA